MGDGLIHDRLTPYDCVFIMIDYQLQFALTINAVDRHSLVRNAVGLAKTARMFSIPTVFTTLGENSFGGPVFPKLREVFPGGKTFPRMSMSLWEDEDVVTAIEAAGRHRLVVAGLWTDFCVVRSVLPALERGYEVFVVTDACGDLTLRAHDDAIQRMIHAGAVPMTWLQVFLELEFDPKRKHHNDLYLSMVKEHAGAYGLDVVYPLGNSPSRRIKKMARRV